MLSCLSSHSNVITRAVGPEANVDVEVQEIDTEPDDLYLLCSDGLTDMVDDVTMAEILCDSDVDLAAGIQPASKHAGRIFNALSLKIHEAIHRHSDTDRLGRVGGVHRGIDHVPGLRGLEGNICRCTGYDKIIRAVLDTAAEMRGQ